MSTSIEPSVAFGDSAEPENLGLLHLAVERKHDRSAVLRRRAGATWQDTPDWRFHRHAMRIALYLKERGQLKAGDRVALVSRLRPEWAVVQWAALTQGMPTAAIDPTLPDAELTAHLAALAPRAVFI
jgi:long-subunit acyl-CoA synthetase (AMP-forming)